MTADVQLERALVGAVLVSPEVLGLTDALPAEAFTDALLRRAWRAVLALDAADRPIEVTTIASDASAGDADLRSRLVRALAECTDGIPRSWQAVPDVAARLRDLASCRALVAGMEDLLEKSKAARSSGALREDLEALLRGTVSAEPSSFVPLSETIFGALDAVEERRRAGGGLAGLPTGFAALDRRLCGLRPGALYVVGARPAVGKTAFLLNVSVEAARARQGVVAIFSLEMPRQQLEDRLLAEIGSVDMLELQRGTVAIDGWERLAAAANTVAGLPLSVDDSPALPISALHGRAKRLAARGPVSLIVVDYLQLVKPDRHRENRVNEVGEVSAGLKALAKELRVPVIAAAQVNRASEARANPRPQLADIRESGSIEQDADSVMFLYRPELVLPEDDSRRAALAGVAELIVAKNRQGPIGSVRLRWDGSRQRFSEVVGGGDA